MAWQVMKATGGKHHLVDTSLGAVFYMENGRIWSSASRQAAERKLLSISANPMPSVSNEGELTELIANSFISTKMRGALRDLLVARTTWKLAASRNGVSEAGILMALRRLSNKPSKKVV